MGKWKDNPRNNVISMRVSDSDKQSLMAVSKENSMTIASLMREAMNRYFKQNNESKRVC